MKLLTERQAAEILGVSEHTLRNWRYADKGPPYVKLVFQVRYSEKELLKYIEERTRLLDLPVTK